MHDGAIVQEREQLQEHDDAQPAQPDVQVFNLVVESVLLLEAVCWLRTHELGWELALNVNGQLQRSQVLPQLRRGAQQDRGLEAGGLDEST